MIFYGALVSSTSLTAYTAAPHALISVSDSTGVIEWVEEDVPVHVLQDTLAKYGAIDAELVELKRGEFLMPGLIDTHTHAPQVPNIGSGQEYELLDWLAQVTFPMEARFKDPQFARRVYENVVQRFIDCGTTTCCYYGTLHLEATKILADIVHTSGQRAFVGKCNMDRNSSPTYVEASPAQSVTDTRALIAYIRGLSPTPQSARVQPILTPRFAISCTPELLSELGALATADPALAIQTHISENINEITFTKELFPPEILPGANKGDEVTYAGVYDAYGLLRDNTVLAHAVHLEPSEVELIRARKAGISHCPTSNFNLRSGCAHVGELLDAGIKVGLGTDVSGGFAPSILTAVQHASIAAKVVAMQHPPSSSSAPSSPSFASRQLPVATLLYLATQGGADVCGLGARVGSLAPGKAFDALVVSVAGGANPGLWGVALDDELGVRRGGGEGGVDAERRELESMVERFLFTGDDRNIRRVYVDGRWIGGVEFAR